MQTTTQAPVEPTRERASDVLHAVIEGDGDVVLLLHGLLASGVYWPAALRPPSLRARVVVVDLKGYGGSMHLPGPYGFAAQVDALEDLLRARGVGTPRVVVGHSFGSLVALAAAARWPAVETVVAFDLPVFHDADEARDRVARLGLMARWIAHGSPAARRACALMCRWRPAFRALAPVLAPEVPRAVAWAGVEHTWPAFDATFRALVEDVDARAWLAATSARVVVVQGRDDDVCGPDTVRDVLRGLRYELVVHDGDHQLPLRAPAFCRDVVTGVLARGR